MARRSSHHSSNAKRMLSTILFLATAGSSSAFVLPAARTARSSGGRGLVRMYVYVNGDE